MKVNIKKGYQMARKISYPSVEEQLDILFHQGFDAWKAVVQAVKDANPKDQPSE